MNARPGIVLLYQHLKPARSSPATLGRISAFSETLNSSQVLLGMDFTSQTIDPTGVSLVRGARTARGVVQSLAEDVDNSQLWKVFGAMAQTGGDWRLEREDLPPEPARTEKTCWLSVDIPPTSTRHEWTFRDGFGYIDMRISKASKARRKRLDSRMRPAYWRDRGSSGPPSSQFRV